MSELKVYVKPLKTNVLGQTIVGQSYYLKSEADKVIAELKDDVTYWKKVAKKNMDDNVAMARERAKAFESEHRHKYKRCLAMAKYCELREDEFGGDFAKRWLKRWLALAEDPTWAKFLQLIRKEVKR